MQTMCNVRFESVVVERKQTSFEGGSRFQDHVYDTITLVSVRCKDPSCKKFYDGTSSVRAFKPVLPTFDPKGLQELRPWVRSIQSIEELERTGVFKLTADAHNEHSRNMEDYKVTPADVRKVYEDLKLIDEPWPSRSHAEREVLRVRAELARRFPHITT